MENTKKVIDQRYAELLDAIAELITSKNAKIEQLEENCMILRSRLDKAEATIMALRSKEA